MKSKNKTISIYILFLALIPSLLFGQYPEIRSSITPSEILIGEQAVLHLDLSFDAKHNPYLGFPKEFELGTIELLGVVRSDTTLLNDRKRVVQEFLITSFDSGLYSLDMKVVIGADTFSVPSVGLKVSSMPIDTTNLQIANIKTVVSPPFVWADYHYYLLLILGLIALFWSIIYFVQELRKRSRQEGEEKSPKVMIAPHVLALQQLSAIRHERLWTQGQDKLYYTQLTDVVRNYIEQQFGINALEMTSGELLDTLRTEVLFRGVKRECELLFELSDMVKFAKYSPTTDDHERSLVHSFMIVEHTIVKPVSDEPHKDLN